MYDINNLIIKINDTLKRDCFVRASESDISYLKTLRINTEIIDFYRNFNPKNIIDINGIRLLLISIILEENIKYAPGYILSLNGYCIIATTIFGDVYCVNSMENIPSIFLASHDEIEEGTENVQDKMVFITNDFNAFLNRFVEGSLPKEYYELEK